MHSPSVTDQRRTVWLFIAALALNMLALWPILHSGYIGDDALNSQLPGALWERRQTLTDFMIESTRQWMAGGRVFPLSLYGNALYVAVTALPLYKAFLLLMVLVNLVGFGYLVRLITGSGRAAVFALVVMPAVFQLRFYHDALLSYHGLLQIVFLETIVSLVLLHRFLTTGRTHYFLGSLGLYLASLLTYEITYVFFGLHLAMLAYASRETSPWRRWRPILPYVGVTALCALASVAARMTFGMAMVSASPSHAYVVHPDLATISLTILRQVLAALPLIYHLIDPHQVFHGAGTTLQPGAWTAIVLLLGVITVLALVLRSSSRSVPARQAFGDVRLPLALGAGLLVLPALLISLSPKYQSEVIWGIGYLPVYISAYGVALLAVGLLMLASRSLGQLHARWRMALAVLAIGSIGLGAYVTHLDNQLVVQGQNTRWKWPRQTIETAMAKGLLSDLNEQATLYSDNNHLWETPTFYRMHTKTRIRLVGIRGGYLETPVATAPGAAPQAAGFWQDRSGDPNCFYVRYDANVAGNGYAVAAQSRILTAANARLYAALSERARLFVSGPHAHQPLTVSSALVDPNRPEASVPFLATRAQLKLIESGPDWELLEVSGNGRLLDLKLFNVNDISGNLSPSAPMRLQTPDLLPRTSSPATLVHVGFRDGYVGNGLEAPILSLGPSFTLEALVRPAPQQAGYAGLMGNHPGHANYEGWVLQQEGDQHNHYRLGYGNGQRWHDGPGLYLSPEQWHYLAIRVDGERRRIEVYLNGRKATESVLVEAIRPSGMPLFIGNWIGGDRPFKGQLREARVTNSALPASVIEQGWKAIDMALDGRK